MGQTLDEHALASLLAVALFALVWLGLAAQVRKIAGRQAHPPSFSLVLTAAHLGRFGGWALIGAAIFHVDPWTGGMLMVTRTPAVALVLVTLLQRRVLRPSPGELLRWLALPLGALLAAGLGLLAAPGSAAIAVGLQAFVAACFAAQGFYALPRQIVMAWHEPLGNLRWFQLSLLANYAGMLVYASFVREEGAQLLMRAAYGVVLVEQAVLVILIERGVRAHRRATTKR